MRHFCHSPRVSYYPGCSVDIGNAAPHVRSRSADEREKDRGERHSIGSFGIFSCYKVARSVRPSVVAVGRGAGGRISFGPWARTHVLRWPPLRGPRTSEIFPSSFARIIDSFPGGAPSEASTMAYREAEEPQHHQYDSTRIWREFIGAIFIPKVYFSNNEL